MTLLCMCVTKTIRDSDPSMYVCDENYKRERVTLLCMCVTKTIRESDPPMYVCVVLRKLAVIMTSYVCV